MPFFCPKEGRSEGREGVGHWEPRQSTLPHNPSHLVCLAPKQDRNALWFESVSDVPVQRSLRGVAAWSEAHALASFPLGQTLPGADDLFFDGLVT